MLVVKPHNKRQLGRFICIWEDNIKMDLTEMCCEDEECIAMVKNRVQG
jgi:hypothetical protein